MKDSISEKGKWSTEKEFACYATTYAQNALIFHEHTHEDDVGMRIGTRSNVVRVLFAAS
jgi:hypothetical protein